MPLWAGQCAVRSCQPCCHGDPNADTIRVEEGKITCVDGSKSRQKADFWNVDGPLQKQQGESCTEQFSAIQLLSRLHTRLWKEGLEFRDMPDINDCEFALLLTELGFDSALERAKLRKAVRDLLALRCPSDTKRSVGTLSTMASIDDEIASQVSSDFVPALGAYYTGEPVEFFSKRLRVWLPAEVTAEPRASGQDVVYSATVLPQRQEHYDVGLPTLRPPLLEGEPCEVFSHDSRWLQAVTCSSQQNTDSAISYRVTLLDGHARETQVAAERVRRRFPQGSLVSVYQGPGLGWTDAMVVSVDVQDPLAAAQTTPVPSTVAVQGSPERSRASRGSSTPVSLTPQRLQPQQPELNALDPEMRPDVLICTETGDTIEQLLHVPAHLLRFRPEYIHQYALWSPMRAEAASAVRRDGHSMLMQPESFVVAPPEDGPG